MSADEALGNEVTADFTSACALSFFKHDSPAVICLSLHSERRRFAYLSVLNGFVCPRINQEYSFLRKRSFIRKFPSLFHDRGRTNT